MINLRGEGDVAVIGPCDWLSNVRDIHSVTDSSSDLVLDFTPRSMTGVSVAHEGITLIGSIAN